MDKCIEYNAFSGCVQLRGGAFEAAVFARSWIVDAFSV